MKDEMPDVIYLNQSKTSYYTTAEMSVGADVSTSYTRTDIHESEVKRLQDAMELARGEVNKLEARIRQKKGFYSISVGHDAVKQAHKAGTLKGLDVAHEEIKQTLTAIDAALKEE